MITKPLWTGDDMSFGISTNGNRSLTTRLVSRPTGLTNQDWWKFCGELAAVMPAFETDSYVQPVPDKCDRIVWRGNYYRLPLPAPVACRVPDELVDVPGGILGYKMGHRDAQLAAPVARKPAAYACIVDGAWHGAWKHEMDARYAGFETEKRFDLVPLYFDAAPQGEGA